MTASHQNSRGLHRFHCATASVGLLVALVACSSGDDASSNAVSPTASNTSADPTATAPTSPSASGPGTSVPDPQNPGTQSPTTPTSTGPDTTSPQVGSGGMGPGPTGEGGSPPMGTGGMGVVGGDGPTGGMGGAGTAGQANGGASGAATTDPSEACAEGALGAHFVDATAGDDNGDGLTTDTAWQTLERVNSEQFEPGDAICFKAGEVWTGEFAPVGSGSSDAPVIVDRYGDGADPRIDAGQGDLQAVLIRNFAYIEVAHLEVTNDQGGPGDYRGVSIRGRDAGQIDHVHLRNLHVHDVTGQVNWIGGDAADTNPPWIAFQTGWDNSKRTGGIVFETEIGSTQDTWFNDILVENSIIENTSFGGIITKQIEALGGVRNSTNDQNFRPHTNIVVRGNFLSQSDTDYGCNTIYVTGGQHVLIERNVTRDSGTSAIEIYNTDDAIIQHNETYGTVRKAGGADFNGIDADRATTGAIIQYNYVHDNGDGILLAQFGFGDSIIRYNVIANSSRMGINLHSDTSATSHIYNNLFYGGAALTNTSGAADLLNGNYDFSNNIFFGTGGGATVRAEGNVTYDTNLFSGVASAGSNAVTGDPLFSGAVNWPSGDASGPALDLSFLTLQTGSPAIDKGKSITDDGRLDFFGNALSDGMPDIGPHETQ